MNLPARIAVAALVIPLLLIAATAQAGRIVSRSGTAPPGAEDIIEFNARGDLRIGGGTLPESMGMIARDGRFYFFGEISGKPVVVDMDAAQKKAQAKGMKKEDAPPPAETFKSLRPAGRRQTVAGLEGEVFVVSWAAGAATREEEVVLTRDPRLAPLLKTLVAVPEMGEKTAAVWLRDAVVARGYFLLRSEREQVVALDFAEVPAERFALKAKPSDDIELLFQMIFGAAFGQLGQALGEATQAVGEGLGAALGGGAAGASASANVATGPAPLTPASREAGQKVEAALRRLAKPGGLQLPQPQTDYGDWTLHDGGPLLLHLPPVNGYSLSSGGGSIKVDFEPADMEVRVFLEMAFAEALPGAALDAAKAGYRALSARLGKGEILGFQPMALDGIAGTVEIYDDPDGDGDGSWRVVKWTGYLEGEGEVSPVECHVALRPEGYEQFAPRIGGILQSLRMPAPSE